MIKKLKKVGNSNALVLDKAILELVGLGEGSEVQITINEGSIIITPAFPKTISEERFQDALAKTISERREALQKLAE